MNLIRVIRKYDIKKSPGIKSCPYYLREVNPYHSAQTLLSKDLTCFFLFNMYPDFRTIFLLAALMISESSGKQNHFLSDVLGYL